MILKSSKASLAGAVEIPASKSHTIRALAFATLANGSSTIRNPLKSADTLSCVAACRALGASIETNDEWLVEGVAGRPRAAENVIDVGNSGTTLYVALGMAALSEGVNIFTGDDQIRRRSAANLLNALNSLGAGAESTRGNGCAPIIIRGRLRGGSASISCPTSQYLSSLLISAPLADKDTHIEVPLLHEQPYVCMTLDWMDRLDVEYSQEGLHTFDIPGGQKYQPFSARVAGDFSSATFFLCAAAITGAELTLNGLNMNDPQGDKAVIGMLKEMGALIESKPMAIRITGRSLKGRDLDLNATPDALPAMAIAGCFAEGTTRLLNVPQARIKETDRIKVMCQVINALGGSAQELPDGLVVHGTGLRGGKASGHADHRIVMACAIAGLASDKPVEVDTAEAMSITFPDFVTLMNQCGAKMSVK